MIDSYEEALAWIHGQKPGKGRLGLARMKWLVSQLGHPETKKPTIHIAGTNGKGSTLTFLRCMLENLGLNVGTFTSPFMTIFNERISINGEPISNGDLVDLVNQIKPFVDQLAVSDLGVPTEFEVVTAMMFQHFSQIDVDVVLVEVGIGGLIDCTNVITPKVSVITTVGYDHMGILGDTLTEIATQKAGIIKPNVPVVVGNLPEEARQVVIETANEKNSPLYLWEKDFQVSQIKTLASWGESFTFTNKFGTFKQLEMHMLGNYQIENAAVAIETFIDYCKIMQLPYQIKDISKGVAQAFWAGRMEKIQDQPLILLDGAHNEPAIDALVKTIKQDFSDREIYLIFSAMADKDTTKMLAQLQAMPNIHLIVTSFAFPRAASAASLAEKCVKPVEQFEEWQEALLEVSKRLSSDDVLLFCGSLYFISTVRQLFQVEQEEKNESCESSNF